MGCCGCTLSASTITACVFGIIQSLSSLGLNIFFIHTYFTLPSLLQNNINQSEPDTTDNNTSTIYFSNILSDDFKFAVVPIFANDNDVHTIQGLLIAAAGLNCIWFIVSVLTIYANLKRKAVVLRVWVFVTSLVIITDIIFVVVFITQTLGAIKALMEMLLEGASLNGEHLSGLITYFLLICNFHRFGVIGLIINTILAVYTNSRAKEIQEMDAKNVFREPKTHQNYPFRGHDEDQDDDDHFVGQEPYQNQHQPKGPSLVQYPTTYQNAAYEHKKGGKSYQVPPSDYDDDEMEDEIPPLSNSNFQLQRPVVNDHNGSRGYVGNFNNGSQSYNNRGMVEDTEDQYPASINRVLPTRSPSMANKLKPPIYQPTAFHLRNESGKPERSPSPMSSRNPVYQPSDYPNDKPHLNPNRQPDYPVPETQRNIYSKPDYRGDELNRKTNQQPNYPRPGHLSPDYPSNGMNGNGSYRSQGFPGENSNRRNSQQPEYQKNDSSRGNFRRPEYRDERNHSPAPNDNFRRQSPGGYTGGDNGYGRGLQRY